jgi:hypothetical protein
MVINNLSAQVTTECGLLQQELLKSFVEARKQIGITESLMKRLAVKKMNAIEDMYGNVHVTNDKFGECRSDFDIDATDDRITLTLKYYVYRIPLDGLSKHDKSVAIRYNKYVYSYDTANNVSSGFKTFRPWGGLTGRCDWSYSIDDILKSDFLTEGISIDNAIGGVFKVFLK